jgi:hypothetical protein
MIGIIKDHEFTTENIYVMKFGLLDLCGLGFTLKQFATGNSNFDYINAIPNIIQILEETPDKANVSKILKVLSLYTSGIETYTKFSDSSKSEHTKSNNKVTKSFILRKFPPTKDNRGNIVKNTFGMNMIINDGKNKRTSPSINIDSERAYSLGRQIELLHERAFRLQLESNNVSINNNNMLN